MLRKYAFLVHVHVSPFLCTSLLMYLVIIEKNKFYKGQMYYLYVQLLIMTWYSVRLFFFFQGKGGGGLINPTLLPQMKIQGWESLGWGSVKKATRFYWSHPTSAKNRWGLPKYKVIIKSRKHTPIFSSPPPPLNTWSSRAWRWINNFLMRQDVCMYWIWLFLEPIISSFYKCQLT